jgi:hypothetical protein
VSSRAQRFATPKQNYREGRRDLLVSIRRRKIRLRHKPSSAFVRNRQGTTSVVPQPVASKRL